MRLNMALDPGEASDASSVLSDIPSLMRDDDSDTAEDPGNLLSPNSSNMCPPTPSSTGFSPTKRLRNMTMYSPYASSSEDSSSPSTPPLRKRTKLTRKVVPLSPIERLPNEILQNIAAELEDDTDLRNLLSSSPIFLKTINDKKSEVWRSRFIHQYDHPVIDSTFDFSAAYKLRKLVLKNFVTFAKGVNKRTYIQLEVLRDMLVETYYEPRTWCPPSKISRNLELLKDPKKSLWICDFLSIAYPNITGKNRYGEPDSFFETIQLVMSHLLLSPSYALARLAAASRDKYDMIKVYNFNRPFTTLYTRHETETPPIVSPSRSRLFPNLRVLESLPYKPEYKLDTNSLLHIRNFWHYHFNKEKDALSGEHTFNDMANVLMKMGKTPQEWSQALGSKSIIPTQWYGVYGCIHDWPKTRKLLEEIQSCTEHWTHHVEPLKLDFLTSSDYEDGFWPPVLSNIPAVEKTIPRPVSNSKYRQRNTTTASKVNEAAKSQFPKVDDNNPVYIRGIASYINTREYKDGSTISSLTSSVETVSINTATTAANDERRAKFLKYHPFNSLRIRGVIHDIPPDSTIDYEESSNRENISATTTMAIPGWKRIVMVVYKPNVTYLVNVLEHALEDYGGPFGAQVTNILNTASVWNGGGGVGGGGGSAPTTTTANTTTSTSTTSTTISSTNTTMPAAPAQNPTLANAQPQQVDPAILHAHLQKRLYDLLTTNTNNNPLPLSSSPSPTLPQNYTPSTIHALEDTFSPPEHLTWQNDLIDYAHIYEGTILPGNKIMLGRYWKHHGVHGAGDGMEVGDDGDGIVVVDVGDNDSTGNGDGDGDKMDIDENDDGNVDRGVGTTSTTTATNADQNQNRGLDRGPFVFWC